MRSDGSSSDTATAKGMWSRNCLNWSLSSASARLGMSSNCSTGAASLSSVIPVVLPFTPQTGRTVAGIAGWVSGQLDREPVCRLTGSWFLVKLAVSHGRQPAGVEKMALRTTKFNMVDYLENEAGMAEYISEALALDD